MKLHAVLKGSLANGPKRSVVVWVQGCSLRCPGCCNPETHGPHGGYERESGELADEIIADESLEGLTISGGEPFDQLSEVTNLIALVHVIRPDMCIVVFTGYSLYSNGSKTVQDVVRLIDILVEGPYMMSLPGKDPLVASTNQKVSFPTGRYGPDDLVNIPRVEVLVKEDGTTIETGFGSLTRGDHEQLD